MNLPRTSFRLLLSTGVAAMLLPVHAAAQSASDQDTRLRLDQQGEVQRRKAERERLKDAEDWDTLPTSLELDGTTYEVRDNVDDMGRALYIAIGRKQWRDVRRFLAAYRRYPDQDPMLVLSAEGALARQQGKLAEAERRYRELLRLSPGFMPARLELARVLFENHKDREARRAFEDIRGLLASRGEQSRGVLATVDAFLGALKQRRSWQGSFALGPGYSTNLNQSSASYTCLLAALDGSCLFERKVPDPIRAMGLNFEGTLGRTLPFSGHQAARVSALLFGDVYPGHHDFSQTTLMLRAGYQYQSARDTVTLSPSLDLGTFGSNLLYEAPGGNAVWQHVLSPRTLLRIEANYRDYRYRQRGFRSQDGALTDLSLTAWYAPSPGWSVFAGPDFANKDAPAAVDAYRQWGARLGVNKAFGNAASLLLIGSWRHRDTRAFNEVFAARRREDQYNATAIARFPGLQFARLVPELVLQHTRVESTIDWLFSYRRTSASLRLSRTF
ncbi:surface lipoprotein assembly modifier [Novosphingobium sp. ZW T3_23]|uniref:surface lipoprotein assembly modifier n=1 Tax=Novosphingobium sp. ZW T3_23 TaxID=3378084 RepID=UPI0038555BBB